MKDYVKLCLLLFIVLIVCPGAALVFSDEFKSAESPPVSAEISDVPAEIPVVSDEFSFSGENIKILITKTGEITEIPITEYITYCILAETPPDYETAALEANAVILNTYAVRQIVKQSQNPDPKLMGADVSDDFTEFQAFLDETSAENLYGEDFTKIYKKINGIVLKMQKRIIVSDDEPIIAAMHRCSPGQTASALDVWGTDIPYLVSVDSSFDKTYEQFTAEEIFTPAEIKARFSTEVNINFNDDIAKWINITTSSHSGVVTTVKVGDKTITGTDFRRILNLQSAAFAVTFDGENFTVKTTGSGHAVGLSRYGSNEMAKRGATWEEIILHYYPGTEIANIEVRS
ncbi:MAG: stage II sporulation protein D [Ruminococcus sp.]|jgi:stage II sporulation protein D|nr:stage II sporulation protein D [Ruminococcus sp.]